jgi:hypothetical protein
MHGEPKHPDEAREMAREEAHRARTEEQRTADQAQAEAEAQQRRKARMEGIGRKIDPHWASWFAGFVDGEGYFQIHGGGDRSFSTRLVITLREDDEAVLREVEKRLGCGNVYHVEKSADREGGMKASDQFMWVVGAMEEVNEIIIPLFEQHPPRSKKKREYEIWKEAAALIYRGANNTQRGRDQIARLKREIKSERSNTSARKSEPAHSSDEEDEQRNLFQAGD